MYILASLLELTLLVMPPDSSSVSILVVDDSDDVSSAHIYLNKSAVASTDDFGKAVISGVQIGDEISVSHIAYETESFTVKALRDTTISLTPKYFAIQGSEYSLDYDFDILKSKRKKGLSCGTLKNKIPVASIDTLIVGERSLVVRDSGYLAYLVKNKEPILTGYKARIIDRVNTSKNTLEKDDINKLKSSLSQKLSNVGFYAECACKSKKYKGFRVEYRGTVQDDEVFYFFIPPQDNGNTHKCRGFLYIDSKTGILHHIEATCTSTSAEKASYDLSVDYHYLEASNSILPKEIHDTTYYLEEDGSIFQTHRRTIVLDWEHLEP